MSNYSGAAPGTPVLEQHIGSAEGPGLTSDHQLRQVRLAALDCEGYKLAGQRHASARGDEQLFLLHA